MTVTALNVFQFVSLHVCQKLDEAHEELQRVTEEEKLLRDRCTCLEEKHRLKQEEEKVPSTPVYRVITLSHNHPSDPLSVLRSHSLSPSPILCLAGSGGAGV